MSLVLLSTNLDIRIYGYRLVPLIRSFEECAPYLVCILRYCHNISHNLANRHMNPSDAFCRPSDYFNLLVSLLVRMHMHHHHPSKPGIISSSTHNFLEETHSYLSMHLPLSICYLLLVGVCNILNAASQECPRLAMKAKTRPNSRRGILAGSGNVKISVTLRAKDPVNGLEFKMLLPRGMTVERTATRPHLKLFTSPEIVENFDGTTALYWLRVDLDRSKKRRFMAKVQIDKCASETLAVDATAYLVNATNISCTTPLPSPALVHVRYRSLKQSATCAPTAAPSVNPAEPFVLFAEGQRFSTNGRLAPFDDRRLSLPSRLKHRYGLTPSLDVAYRQLQTISTPEDCFKYCSLIRAQIAPFLFNWNNGAGECYCCMGVCTPFVFDPAFDTYEVLLPATLTPTIAPSSPLVLPTPSPSTSPTTYEGVVPATLAPTVATTSPVVSPTSSPSKIGRAHV